MPNSKELIMVTNNDLAVRKYERIVGKIIFLDNYIDVLITSRNMIYSGCRLMATPQASGLKPNQTPFRTILLNGGGKTLDSWSASLMEKAIESYKKWHSIPMPEYDKNVKNDFKIIDLSMIENVLRDCF